METTYEGAGPLRAGGNSAARRPRAAVPIICQAEHPQDGTLYAAVDPGARYVTGLVKNVRLASLLSPFPTETEAWAVLEQAGALVGKVGAK